MSSITRQQMGRYIYIYESTSFWEPRHKYPSNRKKVIGKIDNGSGVTYYKQEYIDRLEQEGTSTDGMIVWHDNRKAPRSLVDRQGIDEILLAQEILDTVKSFGLAYFLQSVAEKIGLVEIMSQASPRHWQKLLVLACFLVAEDKPVMYCSDWIEENECPDVGVGNMLSQRISELLSSIGHNERNTFFRLWYQHIREKEYIALDITSVSSYSEHNSLSGWGRRSRTP